MRKNPGDRVYAVLGTKDGVVHVFGSGVYVGDEVPGEDPAIPLPVGFIADMRPAGLPNPLIKLDGGQYVWGCECWWGLEESVIKRLAGRSVVRDDIDAVRLEISRNPIPSLDSSN